MAASSAPADGAAPRLSFIRVLSLVPLIAALAAPEVLNDLAAKWQAWSVSGVDNSNWRTVSWPLTDARSAILIATSYTAFAGFVPVLGLPNIDGLLKPVKIVYNAVQVGLCAWMTVSAVQVARARGYSLLCNDFDPSKLDVANVLWFFYASKVLDMMDTIIIVLGHKWKQLSFLHVYHHASIFSIYWLNITRGYDGDVYFTIPLTGTVVMYGYYLARTLNITVPGILKRSMTMSQLVQFVGMMSQAVFLLFNSCPYPRNIVVFYFLYIFSLFVLFARFYVQSYFGGNTQKRKGAPRRKTA